MIEIIMGTVAILVMPIILLIAYMIGGYNSLVTAKQNIKEQWSNILTEQQRRADLIMNLVETVKSYKIHESKTLKEVIEARKGNFGKTQKEQLKKIKGIDSALEKMMLLFEQYPDLKATQQHNKLMEELSETEDRITTSRKLLNAIINDYNTYVKVFPSLIVANIFKFKPVKYMKGENFDISAKKISM